MDRTNPAKRMRDACSGLAEDEPSERLIGASHSAPIRRLPPPLHPAAVNSIQQHQQHQQQPALAMVPHEILVMILGNLLIGQYPVELHSKRRSSRTKRVKTSTDAKSSAPLISVLLSCRSMYFAGLEVFYERNVLKFHQALHLRQFVSGLSDDQRWAIRTIEMHLQWTKPRRGGVWGLLHQSDLCCNWRDELDWLPRLKSITINSYSRLNESEMMDALDVAAFERITRGELGHRFANALEFVWPDGRSAP